ncbi:Rdx family protein [Gemmata sp. G18]|uniref:Rdx family protein n=1 Tax=Gemmata palustris TaxID=2822762 RepID=A0ABS5C2Z2_9BACT|nr:Rdx family protein [Gemmata palustris]
MTATLLSNLKQKIKGLTLVPAGGGCFEVTLNGELIYSKLKTGQFPDEQTVLESVRDRLKK